MRPRIVLGILGTLLKITGVFMPNPGVVLTNYDEPSGADAFCSDIVARVSAVYSQTMEEMICEY
jgi:hypothetical protein